MTLADSTSSGSALGRHRRVAAERGDGCGGHRAAVVAGELSQGQPGGQCHPGVPAAQNPRQLLDRPGPDPGQRAVDRLLQLGRQRRGRGHRAARRAMYSSPSMPKVHLPGVWFGVTARTLSYT